MFKKFSPTDFIFMGLAFATIVFSKLLYLNKDYQEAVFVGLWVPSILAFGIYLKIIENSK